MKRFGIILTILSLWVGCDEDGFHRMDYQKMIVPLVKAVQELTAKVEKLENHIIELESDNEKIIIGMRD